MGREEDTQNFLQRAEECLARLKQELVILDDLEAMIAAIKLSEACDALELEIHELRHPPSFE